MFLISWLSFESDPACQVEYIKKAIHIFTMNELFQE